MTQLELSKPTLAKLNEDYPKVKNVIAALEIEDLMNFLVRILNIKTASAEEQDHLDFQMPIILDFIKSKFGMLTIPEIKEAFKMYVAREFADIKVFRILDCVVVGEILGAYRNFSIESLRVYDAKKQKLLQEPTGASDLEKKAIRKEFLKVVFEDLIAKGYCDNLWLLWHDADGNLTNLAKKLNARTTEIEKKVLYKKESEFHLEQLKGEQMISRRNTAKLATEDFVRQMQSNQPNRIVVNRCRNITASNYLKRFLTDFEEFKNEVGDELDRA